MSNLFSRTMIMVVTIMWTLWPCVSSARPPSYTVQHNIVIKAESRSSSDSCGSSIPYYGVTVQSKKSGVYTNECTGSPSNGEKLTCNLTTHDSDKHRVNIKGFFEIGSRWLNFYDRYIDLSKGGGQITIEIAGNCTVTIR